ncbi:putative PurR-regulated permease PerM [Orenia marismortui]|uniref:Putative PurR-regulated permease PerM n=2 Tax=Orenia marismortui TaxID=46469 RepID=A0A4R8GM69_9FIRM|nr:putative PurR-regulated permease PerM [Orenia marismortui]
MILLPFILAILLSYLINPLIEELIERGQPRLGALIFVFGVLIALLSFIFIKLFPAIINELDVLAHRLPEYIGKIERLIFEINQKYERIELPKTLTTVLDKVIRRFEEITLEFIERTSRVILSILSRVLSLIMAPILSFYILKDLESIKCSLWELVPKKRRRSIKLLLGRINIALFGFFKGQLIISLAVGILSVIGLYFLKIKFYLLIGILVGIFNIIPYFGPLLGALPAMIMASFRSNKLVFLVVLLFFIIQQIEGNIIAPKIMGKEVGLHPIIIIFSLLAGGELLGIIGMLIAIPIAAIIKEIMKYIFYEVLISVDNR